MRTRPDGPMASRTASTRSSVVGEHLAALGHLDLRGACTRSGGRSSAACSGPTAGTVQLMGMRSRTGSGHGRSAESMAPASQGTHAVSS